MVKGWNVDFIEAKCVFYWCFKIVIISVFEAEISCLPFANVLSNFVKR